MVYLAKAGFFLLFVLVLVLVLVLEIRILSRTSTRTRTTTIKSATLYARVEHHENNIGFSKFHIRLQS